MPAEASFDDFCWWQPVRWNISSALCVRKLVSEAAAKDDGHDGKVMTANEPGLAGLTHGWKAYLLVDNIKSSYERAATALTSIILWTANFQMTNVSLRIFRLQKKKFTARTFDSDTSWTQFRARVTERWSQTLQSRCREERGEARQPLIPLVISQKCLLYQNSSSSVQRSQEVGPVHKRPETEARPLTCRRHWEESQFFA